MTQAAELVIPLNGPQRRARAAIAPRHTIFLGWGRGVGKSKFLRLMLWSIVAEYEYQLRTSALRPFTGLRITVLMPTLKQFKDVHWAGVLDELTSEWAFLGAKLDKQTGQINFPGGSWLKPFPATEYNARTALGLRTDVLVIDECDSVPTSVYDAVAVPWLSEPWSLGIQIVAGTPNMGRHGLWWRTYQQGVLGERLRNGEELPADEGESAADTAARGDALKTIFAFRATYKDAPETVGASAVAKAKATTPDPTFRREWEADPDAGEGLVYPFDERFHVIGAEQCPLREEPLPRTIREFVVGMDHGWVDPGVLLRLGVIGHGEDAVLLALDEHYESEVPNHVWNERAAAWRDAQFWPDPSRPDRINDLQTMGLNVGETDNDIYAGVARVANLLFIRRPENGEPYARLYVHPRCRNLIREFGLYRRKKLPDGTFDEQPDDRDNHAMDALRYAAMGRFGRVPNTRHVSSGR